MSDDFTTTPNYGLYKPTPNADYDLWGDHLNANADKLDAVIRGIAVAGDVSEFQISAAAHGAVPDFVQLAGPVSWNATTVTIAGASFTVADVGKTIIMPAGGVAGAPALVEIVDFTSPTVVTVDQVAGAPFAGLDTVVGGYASNPWSIAISSPGAGGSLVGDVLTVVAAAPAVRPATLQVIQTKVASATVVNAGTGGPPGPVLLRGTTGYGRRVVLSGNVNAGGSLDPTLVLTSSTGADPGAYWYDVDDPNGEPVLAKPRKITLPGSWSVGGTTITLGSTVSPLVMPAIHPGATVFAVADDGNVAFPTGTRVDHIIDSTAMTIQTTQAATHAGSGQQIAFTDNHQDIVFAATFANAATTITATAPVPAGVLVGQTIFGPGLLGSDDPTTPLANTTITAIDGPRTTITISRPTTHAATTAVNLHAVPYLTGAVVKLNLVPAVIAYRDWGAYAGVPTPPTLGAFPLNKSDGSDSGVTVSFATQAIKVSCGTDNNAAINAWLAAVRGALGTTGQGLEAVLPPGAYLTLGSINAHDLNQPFTMRVSGVSIHSAGADRAWDASGSRYYRMVGDFVVVGDKLFPPDIGLLFAYSNLHGITSNVSLIDVSASGFFKFAATYLANTEGYVVSQMQSSNGQTWADKDTPCFGKVIDGDNSYLDHVTDGVSYGKLDAPVYQTHASFLGFLEDGGTSTCNNGAVPFSIIGCSNYEIRGGYGASWSAPIVFFSKSGHAKLNIHCEVETLTDAMFMWARSNNVVSFGSSVLEDGQCEATNSAISYDVLGKFGVPIRGFTATNSRLLVTPSGSHTFPMQVFDDHSAFTGTLVWHGDISVSGALKTASVHWLANLPDDREGSLLLGDDKTNYSGDFISAGTITSGGIISAGDDISTTGWVNAEDGIRIGAVGFPRANLTFDGSVIIPSVPIANDINTVTVPTVTANSISVPAGTNYVVVSDSVHAVNTLTVGSGTIADGYDLWMSFPNGGVFSGQTLTAHGNLTLKVLGGGWSILSKFG